DFRLRAHFRVHVHGPVTFAPGHSCVLLGFRLGRYVLCDAVGLSFACPEVGQVATLFTARVTQHGHFVAQVGKVTAAPAGEARLVLELLAWRGELLVVALDGRREDVAVVARVVGRRLFGSRA